MTKILVLGSTGMLGHVVERYFTNQEYDVYSTTRNKNNDLYFDAEKDIKSLEKIIKLVKPDVVINCVGILNKDADENKAVAVQINSYLPHYIDDLSKYYNFKFVHISTDCVFDGKKGNYSEDSEKDAKSFYGQSKALGEINNDHSITLRTSIIGPDTSEKGIGLFKWFMDQEGEVNGFSEVIWTGVTTIELAKQIEVAINNNLTGLYHVVNGDKIDKYSLLQLFKTHFQKEIIINKNDQYKSDKSLVATRTDFKFDIPSYDIMIKEMNNWVVKNNDLYEEKIGKSRCKQ